MDGQPPIAARETNEDAGERDRIGTTFELCHQAKAALGPWASFRLRVLLDMVLLELRKQKGRTSDSR